MTEHIANTVTISDIREEVPGVKTFYLDPAGIEDYKAGQYITILSPDDKERRSYSFSSAPGETPCFTVKRIDNGLLSRWLIDRAKPGNKINVTGINGFFTLPENPDHYRQLFFFAAGIGITPVYSMIKSILVSYPDLHVTLVYSNTSKADTVFYEELKTLALQYRQQFTLEFLFSSSSNLLRARLSKQLIPTLLKEYTRTQKEKILFYTCGPFAYMRMVLLGLEEQNIQHNNIRKENFNSSIPILRAAPPEKERHAVTIRLKDKDYHFHSRYPDTILTAARKEGINLPYSCGNGMCGSCSMRCIAGHVWHNHNEVLTDAELNKGIILTCVGYPIGGDIILETL